MTTINLPSNLSGYETTDDYVAQRTVQGERVHYMVAIPLPRVPEILPVPDPKVPFDDNRIVRESHAKAFADYLYANEYWHSGPLTIRTTSQTVSFDVATDLGTLQIGTLKVPRSRRGEFRIVDGQHRVLGVQKLLELISAKRLEQSNLLQKARDNGAEPAVIRQFEKNLEEIGLVERRAQSASIVIDLVIENDDERARQIFVDVADNALGINKAVKDRFDMRKVVNRALNDFLNSPPEVLNKRVDMQKSAISGSNPNWIGAGVVSEIIRILQVGISGRISAAQEKSLDVTTLKRNAEEFFTGITAAFPDLRALADDSISAPELRSKSLLGSATMMKVVAGVYHELTAVQHKNPSVAIKFFERLAPHMNAPVKAGTKSGDLWLNAGTENEFVEGAMAPGARSQQVKDLVNTIAEWVDNPPSGL
jgi:hypothetical protein